jgi:adenylate cyclase
VASRGHVQELAGDNAFLVFPDPESAIDAILNLYRDVEGAWDFPALRTGLHHGSALYRANWYFSTTINMAARTAAQAKGGEILCTAPVSALLARLEKTTFTIDAVGSVKLKNLPQEVEMFALNRLDTGRQRVIDPVCQMQVDKKPRQPIWSSKDGGTGSAPQDALTDSRIAHQTLSESGLTHGRTRM